MSKIILVFMLVCVQWVYGAVNGPPAATQTVLDSNHDRIALFGLIMTYLRDQALFDVVEHYSYLQNRNKDNLNLTKKQRADLQRYVDRYYRLVRAINYQTPVNVTCQAPAQE